jgi:hypothetical protein
LLISGSYDCGPTLSQSCFYANEVDSGQRPAISADGSVIAWVRPGVQNMGTFNSRVGWIYVARVGANGPVADPVAIEPGDFTGHPVPSGGFPKGSIQPALSPDGRFVYYVSEFNPTTSAWNPSPYRPGR